MLHPEIPADVARAPVHRARTARASSSYRRSRLGTDAGTELRNDIAPLPAQWHGIRGIVFEPDNVLYDATLWRRWLLQLLARLGLHAHYESFFCVWEADYLHDIWRGHRDYDEALQAFLLSAGLRPAQIDEVEAASHAKRRELATCRRLLPGVSNTLRSLQRAGFRLGILSDAERSQAELASSFEMLGLGSVFAVVVSSFDLERTKPDRACYDAVVHELELPTAEVLFVGHREDELMGARTAGLSSLACASTWQMDGVPCVERFEALTTLLPAKVELRG